MDDHTFVAVGSEGTIVRSDDSGLSWSVVDSGTREYLDAVAFGDTQTGIAVSTNQIILRTADGGLSWTPQIVDGITMTVVSSPLHVLRIG